MADVTLPGIGAVIETVEPAGAGIERQVVTIGLRGSGTADVFASVAGVTSAALEGSHVLLSGPGTLWDLDVVIGAVSGWLMLFDAVSAPADGAVVPALWVPIYSDGTQGYYQRSWRKGRAFATGITAVYSSTGPLVKTVSATALFSGLVS